MSSENREKILEAALAVLGREGYQNTSIKAIAEEAGVAQGLIHYYFKSKQELVSAALLRCTEQIAVDLDAAGDVVAAFDVFKRNLPDKDGFWRLFVEMVGVGLHDTQLGTGVRDFIEADRDLVEQVGRRLLGEVAGEHTLRSLSAAVYAANLGIVIQHLVDPAFDANAAVDALAQMVMARAAQLTAGGVERVR